MLTNGPRFRHAHCHDERRLRCHRQVKRLSGRANGFPLSRVSNTSGLVPGKANSLSWVAHAALWHWITPSCRSSRDPIWNGAIGYLRQIGSHCFTDSNQCKPSRRTEAPTFGVETKQLQPRYGQSPGLFPHDPAKDLTLKLYGKDLAGTQSGLLNSPREKPGQ
jgi:hypothetical protein